MLKYLTLLTFLSFASFSQDLPYREIPEYPESFSANNVVVRMIEGLAFRYYWATEGLREEDLNYKPSAGGRTTFQTIEHINGLVNVSKNTIFNVPTAFGPRPEKTFEELRKETLSNLELAANLLREHPETELEELKMVFKSENSETVYPFWNLINGPLEDAVWHVGQVITFRRSSGNPYNSKAGVLTGKVSE
ncbi:DinB family protein [Jiulongibacter sediminis]|uniref:DinB-like domain-containing protein n=1 Tax=Jiulongibacter sediminis TaxID=1605367 RepID=A0A0P7BU38_9BACT|nr:hypothetical protein [Jiulongibacter sediminis]KPM48289.1 hypothetical protein AFM12_06440 [Jiulongibacter sediminis]